MTSVGRCSRSISQAVVADLPVPVAPSSTTSCSPARIRCSRSSIAVGWSPEGWKSEITSKGATVRTRSVTGLMRPRYDGRPTATTALPTAISPQRRRAPASRASTRPSRSAKAARVVHDEVRGRQPLLAGRLGGHPGPGVRLGHPPVVDQPREPYVVRRVDDDDQVVGPLEVVLDQQRDVLDHDGVPAAAAARSALRGRDERVHDRVEGRQLVGVGEDDAGRARPGPAGRPAPRPRRRTPRPPRRSPAYPARPPRAPARPRR